MEEDEGLWENIWEEDKGEEFVMGFAEGQARTNLGGQIMGTDIEGGGRLARLQELQRKRDPSAKHELKFMEVFSKIKKDTKYDFGQDAEEALKNSYLGLRHSLYKDPALFIFANIAIFGTGGRITKKGLDEAKKLSRKTEYIFLTEDLIRYCILIGGTI